MPEHEIDNIKFHTLASFDQYGISHGFITRHGGISPTPWDTLNLSVTVGDEKKHVAENIKRVFNTFNIDEKNYFDIWQVHGERVVCANAPRKINEPHQQADAIITSQRGLTLLMRFADCLPILLFDPKEKVIGIAHAGWKGTVRKIVVRTIQTMINTYGSKPENIIAGIGPSIAAHHYEIGVDVIQEVKRSLGNESNDILLERGGSTYFDLWKANQNMMERIGVNQIEISGICTACNTGDWFSHRGENGQSGRFGVFVRL